MAREKENGVSNWLIIGITLLAMVGMLVAVGLTALNRPTYKEIDNAGLQKFIDDKTTGLLYVGRPTCPHCAKFKPILDEVAKGEKVTGIYYYNTDNGRSEDANKLSELMDEINIIGVPTFRYYVDGSIKAELGDVETREALVKFLQDNGLAD